MSTRRPTIRDVARRAGVSVTTVSHTFSGNGKVAAATQQRVRTAAHDLGYHPDVIAQGLRNNRLGVIALVARQLDALRPDFLYDVDYFSRFAGAAAVAALAEGLGLMLVSDPTGPRAAGAALASDGFIVTEPVVDDPLVAMLTSAGIPFVTVGEVPGRSADGPDTAPHVDIESGRLTALALDHLWDGGARRIALVTGTDRNEWNLRSVAVYERWCAHRRMTPSTVRVPEELDGGGHQAAGRLLDAGAVPDGVYALTSDHALGLVAGFAERGLRVPDDVRVVAGSDAESLRSARPTISSIDLEPEELARRAVEALAARLGGRPPPPVGRPVGHLVVRASSAPADPPGQALGPRP
ncbi:LacI family transcriptional regulator [Nocardioides albidus]|uniref:LacI family transcriptional regulator n=1 Tax=Nocardioides albidus TaxID=1517589 RepID=A0A5C4W138_9ACTN|nr:LacI family DNA-binding transcriptional regulator [Nocardioides albidus]TNM41205.1 LacI family transcriptional regulator [Nocardioides albidus]